MTIVNSSCNTVRVSSARGTSCRSRFRSGKFTALIQLASFSLLLVIAPGVVAALDGSVTEAEAAKWETVNPQWAARSLTMLKGFKKGEMQISLCSGAFIGKYTYLTAYHCVEKEHGKNQLETPEHLMFPRSLHGFSDRFVKYRTHRAAYLVVPENKGLQDTGRYYDVAIIIFGPAPNADLKGEKFPPATAFWGVSEQPVKNGSILELNGLGMPWVQVNPSQGGKSLNDESKFALQTSEHHANFIWSRGGKNVVNGLSGSKHNYTIKKPWYQRNENRVIEAFSNEFYFVDWEDANDSYAFLQPADSGGPITIAGKAGKIVGVQIRGAREKALDGDKERQLRSGIGAEIYSPTFAKMLLVAKQLDPSVDVPESYRKLALSDNPQFDPKPYLRNNSSHIQVRSEVASAEGTSVVTMAERDLTETSFPELESLDPVLRVEGGVVTNKLGPVYHPISAIPPDLFDVCGNQELVELDEALQASCDDSEDLHFKVSPEPLPETSSPVTGIAAGR